MTAGTSRQTFPLEVLIPSPLLGPDSWSLVADELNARGWPTLVSVDLRHDPPGQPRRASTVGDVEASLREVAADCPVVLVAHSAAGPLLPAIAAAVRQPVDAYLFVDARPPSPGVSRLDAIADEDPVVASCTPTRLRRPVNSSAAPFTSGRSMPAADGSSSPCHPPNSPFIQRQRPVTSST